MAEKLLNLQLNYKGKYLDTVRYERDFTNSFFIGRDKKMFWQIDDAKFPLKHKVLSKSGANFKLNLAEGMKVTVNKNGAKLSEQELKSQKLLNDNAVSIEPNTEGEIQFDNDWSMTYYFKEPYAFVPSREHVAIHTQYAKIPKLSDDEKFTRIFIILSLIITAIGLYIFEMAYIPPVPISFAERYEIYQETAFRIEPEVVETVEEKVETGTVKQKNAEEAQKVVEEAAEMTEAEFAAEFGLEFGGIDGGEGEQSFAGELLEVNQVGEIIAAGAAPGAGSQNAKNQSAQALNMAGAEGFDLSSTGEGLGDLVGIDGLDLGGTGGFEEVDMASLGGDISNYKTTKIQSKAQFQAIRKKYAGIKMVTEGSIKLEEQTPEMKSEQANITQIVNTYKPQITKQFRVESMMLDMYGTIEYILIIDASGKVQAVDVEVADGSFFSDAFIAQTKEIIMKWNIRVKDSIGYSFRMKFTK